MATSRYPLFVRRYDPRDCLNTWTVPPILRQDQMSEETRARFADVQRKWEERSAGLDARRQEARQFVAGMQVWYLSRVRGGKGPHYVEAVTVVKPIETHVRIRCEKWAHTKDVSHNNLFASYEAAEQAFARMAHS